MKTPERLDRLELKIDSLRDAISDMHAILHTRIEGQNRINAEIETLKNDLAPLKNDIAMAKGASRFTGMLATFIGVLTGVMMFFKK